MASFNLTAPPRRKQASHALDVEPTRLSRVLNVLGDKITQGLQAALDKLLDRPLASCLAGLFVWASGHFIVTLTSQDHKHPAPLFANTSMVQAGNDSLRAKSAPFQLSQQVQDDARERVRVVQKLLTDSGYYYGAIDGVSGSRTERAIKAWQQSTGLKQNTVINDAMIADLRKQPATARATPAQRVELASYSEDNVLVFTVQRRLGQLGYDPGPPDGRLSAQTREAIGRFEKDRGLPVSGTIQSALLKHLTDAAPSLN